MKAFSVLLLAGAGLAQAALEVTSNGVTYTVTYTKYGVELPVVPGPKFDFGSRGRLSGKKRQTSNNWCGVANTNSPGGNWTNIVGAWSVPQISLRQGQSASDQPSIAQWVGIDGDGCGTGLIQGGSLSQVSLSKHHTVLELLNTN